MFLQNRCTIRGCQGTAPHSHLHHSHLHHDPSLVRTRHLSASWRTVYTRGQQTFSAKSQIVRILGFAGPTLSVTPLNAASWHRSTNRQWTHMTGSSNTYLGTLRFEFASQKILLLVKCSGQEIRKKAVLLSVRTQPDSEITAAAHGLVFPLSGIETTACFMQ